MCMSGARACAEKNPSLSNFAGVLGGDTAGARGCLETARPLLEAPGGLRQQIHPLASGALAWAVFEGAPLETRTGSDGSFSLMLGRRGSGYFLSMSASADGAFTVSTDLLGLFPVYYRSTPEMLVFSSTPAFFRYDPGFDRRLSMEGLAGILLCGAMTNGQTLWEGVRRLAPGHRLEWKKGAPAAEIRSARLEPSDRYFSWPLKKQVDLLDGILRRATRREMAGEDSRPLLLLSGGLDSRLAAAYLREACGPGGTAVTQGSPGDIELRCAAPVAREIGWIHRREEPDFQDFERGALLKLEQEQLSHGFSVTFFSQLAPAMGRLGRHFFTGAYGDAALGGSVDVGGCDFEDHLDYFGRRWFGEASLRRLIPGSILGDALDKVLAKLRADFSSRSGEPFQRAMLFDWAAVDRFQIVFPRVLSSACWPRLPFADPELLEAAAALPLSSLAGRTLQRELLCARFPRLAALALDRNNYDTRPVFGLKRLLHAPGDPFFVSKVLAVHASERARGAVERLEARWIGRERRFYHRTLDIRHEGWKGLRQKAWRARKRLEGLVDLRVFEEFLPGPDGGGGDRSDRIESSRRMKLLIGLALWAGENL